MIELILAIVLIPTMEWRVDSCALLVSAPEQTVIEGNLYTNRDYYKVICDDTLTQDYMLSIKEEKG